MGFTSIFCAVRRVEPDSDFCDIPTEIVIYQPSDEFAEPGMPVPTIPRMLRVTSDQGGRHDAE